MLVGLTYDLRADYLAAGYSEEETAEFDRPDTIEALEGALGELGHVPERIGNARALVARLAEGRRWDLVFNIAEGLHGFGREAQVPALLDLYEIPYTFSDPLVLALCLHKGMTLHVLRDQGIPVADFAVVADEADLAAITTPHPPLPTPHSALPTPHSALPTRFPLFVKPVAEGTGKGITTASKVTGPSELAAACRAIWQRLRQPALVESYLPGRELTVGILGTGRDAEAIGALEIRLHAKAEAGAYSYVNKERCEDLVEYVLVEDALADEAMALALAAWRGLGCRDAGRLDFRADADGRLRFLEANPLAGLHPQHSDLPILCTQRGIPYVQLIARIVESALARAGGPPQ